MRNKPEERLFRDWSDNDCLVAPFINPNTEMEFRRWLAERYGEIDAILGFKPDRFDVLPNTGEFNKTDHGLELIPMTTPTPLWLALKEDYIKAYQAAELEHKPIVEFARNLK